MSGLGKVSASFRLHWHLRLRCAIPGELGGTQGWRPAGLRTRARASGSECVHMRGERGGAAWRARNAAAWQLSWGSGIWHGCAGVAGKLKWKGVIAAAGLAEGVSLPNRIYFS